MKEEKYNIDDFYVGQLYVGRRLRDMFDNSLRKKPYEKEIEEDIRMLCANGAKKIRRVNPEIDFKYADEIDNNRWIKYQPMLAIFYKINDIEYLCLNDNKKYEIDRENRENTGYNCDNFCKNLVSFSDLLPKVDYEKPSELTIDEALSLYKDLYSKRFLYEGRKLYDIKDFYIGDFEYCRGYFPRVLGGELYEYSPMLAANFIYESKLGIFFPEENDYRKTDHLHNIYTIKTLFLDKNNELINLVNNQVYPKKVTNIAKADESIIKTLESLSIKLYSSDIDLDKDEITIDEAIKKFKRIRK